MAQITPTPILMSASTLKIGADNFEFSVSSAQFAPTTPVVVFKGIGGNSIPIAGTTDWILNLGYPQDFAAAGSLANKLLNSAGTVVVVDLYPKAGGPGYRASVLLKPGPIGGDVDALLAGTVALEVQGQPALIAP